MLQQVRVGFVESDHQILTKTSTFLWIRNEFVGSGLMHSHPRDPILIIVHAAEQGILLHYLS